MSDPVRDRLAALLAPLGEGWELLPCDPELADTAAFCAAYGVAPEDAANTLLVAGRADPPPLAACLVLATTRLDVNRAVRDRLGTRKASFAPPELTRALTGMELGGVTVLGLPPDLPLWIDAAVMARERVVIGGGSRAWKVRLPPALLRAIPGAFVVEGLATLPPPRDP